MSDHESEKVYLGTLVLKPDTAPPVVHVAVVGRTLLARVHDNRTPNAPHDWRSVAARWDGGGVLMTWYGENLFQAHLPAGARAWKFAPKTPQENKPAQRVSNNDARDSNLVRQVVGRGLHEERSSLHPSAEDL